MPGVKNCALDSKKREIEKKAEKYEIIKRE